MIEGQPAAVKRSLMTQLIFGADDAAVQRKIAASPEPSDKLLEWNRIVGTPQQVIDRIGAYVDAGVERFMLMWMEQDNLADLELFAKEVLPHFHR